MTKDEAKLKPDVKQPGREMRVSSSGTVVAKKMAPAKKVAAAKKAAAKKRS